MHSISLFTDGNSSTATSSSTVSGPSRGAGNHLNWNQRSILSYQGSKYSTNCAASDASLCLRSLQLHGSYYKSQDNTAS